MNTSEAQLARARASMNPDAAIAAEPVADESTVELETPAGVPVVVRRERGITMAVEIDPPPPHRRWRWFLAYHLLKLAARIYPFRVEFFRTRHPWE